MLTGAALVALLWPLHAQINLINLSSSITGTLPIGNGGTGQTTATAAFDALSPVTTRGDLIFRNASNNARLAKGTSGQFLTIGANDPAWAAVPAFTLQFAGGDVNGLNPASNTTYFTANNGGLDPGTTNTIQELVPTACTLRAVAFRINTAGTVDTAANNGTVSLRINDTTDVQITAVARWNVATYAVMTTGLSTALAAGDTLAIKFLTPNPFTTLPTLTFYRATAYCDVP